MIKYKKGDKVIRQFGLSNFSLKNRITVVLLLIMLVILGTRAYNNLPKESYPEVEQSSVYIGTPYPGNSPTDIENLITRPIEKELNTISEIKEIRSNSIQGYSTIVAEFGSGVEIEYAKAKVNDAVDKAKINLPADLPAESSVYEVSFSDFPVMSVTLSGNYSLEKLESYAEFLKDELENISDVSKVSIAGVEEKEVSIKVNPFELEARNLSFVDIENAILYENISVSGGNLLSDNIRRSVRLFGEFKSMDDFRNIIISNKNDRIVYLKDVAEINFGYKEFESYFRLGGKPVVAVDVAKRSGTNLLLLNDKVNDVISKVKTQIPKDIDIIIVNNQSRNTKEQVSTLENSIFSGVILVVLVLMFFLGVRNALFVGLSIPLSMCISFLVFQIFGITVNMMILFSLVISLGLLVDNGIVVTENIYRFLEKGYSRIEATKLGIGEIALPIITSTGTTLAVFVPLAFWPGLTGKFMSFLPIGIIVTLLSSLFVALVINPVLISYLMKIEGNGKKDKFKYIKNSLILFVLGIFSILILKINWIGNILIFISLFIISNYYIFIPLSRIFRDKYLKALEYRYSILLNYLLSGKRPFYVIIFSLFLLIGTFQLINFFPPKILFFPENRPNYINIYIELPVGSDIEETNLFTKKLEKEVDGILIDYKDIIESIVTFVGKRTLNENDPSALSMRDSPNRAKIKINFFDFEQRKGINTIEVLDKLRSNVESYPGVSITFGKDRKGPPVGGEISIEVSGPDFIVLIDQVEKMRKYINEANIPGIEKLVFDLSTRKPEILIDFDRDKLRRYGMSTGMLANELRTSLFGKELSKYKIGEDDYKIQLRLDDEFRYDIDALLNKNITFRNQSNGRIYQVPISSFASMKMSNTYSSIKRKDLDKVITISSNVTSGYNPTNVNSKIDMALKKYSFPNGYTYKFGGEQQEQEVEMAFLSNAFMIALFLVFIIIVAQFNKIITPLIIMSSIILSTIGVFLGLLIFKMDFVVVMTMIGVISLIGIVVNNAIVLIDFIELNRKRKMLKSSKLNLNDIIECISDAGKTRLRPVILTALTTILGLMPLAIGMNFDFVNFFKFYEISFYLGGDNMVFFGPIAWAIIFGLSFATFLTLLVIPSMYLIQVKLNRFLGLS